MIDLLALPIFVALVMVGYALASRAEARATAKHALDQRLEAMAGLRVAAPHSPLLKDRRLSPFAAVNSMLGRISLVTPAARMIRRAGLRRRVGEILLYVPTLAAVGLLVTMLAGGTIVLAVVVAVVAGALPLLVVQRLAHKRAILFADQLPEALDLMRAALQAGHGLISAMSVVAEEFPDPIAQEFRETTDEVRLGLPLREALNNLADRVENRDIPLLLVGVLVAQDVGGNLAEVLDNISYTIRERFKLQREIRVLSAQGRLSAWVLTALPFVAGLTMSLVSPGYFLPMFHKPAGQYMLAYAVVSILIGRLFVQRLVRFKV